MTTFEFTPPGGDPLSDQLAGDRHGYAMLVLAVFAVVSLVDRGRDRPARLGLGHRRLRHRRPRPLSVVDLPDVNKIGDIEVPGGFGLTSAEAVPRPGFWLEAAAAIVLAPRLASPSPPRAPSERQAPRPPLESRPSAGRAPGGAPSEQAPR